jgi:hypothetical protein
MPITLDGTAGITNDATDLNYTGTLTGGTGVINIGSGQLYKDASGNVGIGTSGGSDMLAITDPLNIFTTNFGVGLAIRRSGGTAANCGQITLTRSRGLSTSITSSDVLGRLSFKAYVGSTGGEVEAASITAIGASPTDTTTGVNGILRFNTRTTGGTVSERMRIAADGSQSSVIPGGTTLYPEFKCRAWVNFNGTTSPGTIGASGNVSSVTRSSTGAYTVNFTTAMPDASYAAITDHGTLTTQGHAQAHNYTASSFELRTIAAGVLNNPVVVSASVFR